LWYRVNVDKSIIFKKYFKNNKFSPFRVLTKVLISVSMLTMVLIYGIELVLTTVLFVATLIGYSRYVDNGYGGVGV
jgi:hypothetical protein